ncbi:MAG: flagellar hook-basal body complex protein FliE [Proteobacteria bacterium]|nr:flagellar hook-basal body complex protein FliE [Pseudomonadota bacterium]
MTNSIQKYNPLQQANKVLNNDTPKSATKKIASSFQNMFDAANRDQVKAEKMVTQMVAGKNKDIAGTMITMEKADVSMRMLMAVRNKIVNAYEEMMRMPV